ncbi:MAG: carbohydrate kinase, partial [Sphingobacteriales bacterium]
MAKVNFDELFGRFSGMKIGVIGDVMLDTYWWGHVERISPEAPVPIVALDRKEYRIGGAGNVALN